MPLFTHCVDRVGDLHRDLGARVLELVRGGPAARATQGRQAPGVPESRTRMGREASGLLARHHRVNEPTSGILWPPLRRRRYITQPRVAEGAPWVQSRRHLLGSLR
jgi:hypothetical protein